MATVFPTSGILVCMTIAACFCVASAAAAAVISVQVDPIFGDDSRCSTTLICRSIAYAVQVFGASQVSLASGIFNETTVNIKNVGSLVVSGVPSHTIFDCSLRQASRTTVTGPAFNISNSTVTFTGITFQHCSNANGNGGAVSAVDSSIAVSHCRFFNCSAANGGALSATASDVVRLFLSVLNSTFIRNTAVGGVIGCPTITQSIEPCSTWGGAVAAFEMSNVSVTGCTMVENSALAAAPAQLQHNRTSQNAVAGGGCVSVLFRGNSSASTVYVSDNSFLQCTVHVPGSSSILVGNGIVCCCANVGLYCSRSCLTYLQDTVAQFR